MKITKFETKDHPILGNCSLNFSDNNIILIAGVNGSGKTTILNEIFDFFINISPRNQKYDIIITFELSEEDVVLLKKENNVIDNILKISCLRIPESGNADWNQIQCFNSLNQIDNVFIRSESFKGMLKIIYSTVEVNFSSSQVNSTTSKDIDIDKSPKEKSTAGVSQEITQLLVDIKSLDNQDAADWIDSNSGQTLEISKIEKRIGRFKRAFDLMIEGKTFEGVKNESERKKVYFKDSFGNEIDLSLLSSGEKQIVFRAGYLLKNMKALKGGIVLIDEPEISFHPSWQEKYVDFVKKIFSDENDILDTQIIIATHSPFIIQNKNITNEKIIILERISKDVVESKNPEFYSYKKPEPVFVPIIQEYKPLLLVEGKSDKQIITCAWNKLFKEDIPFDIKWPNEPFTGGAREVQKHLNYFTQYGTQKALGIYDSDQKGLNDFNGTSCKPNNFVFDTTIDSLKKFKKVGVTYLPVCHGREIYFNKEPQISFFVLEMYLSDVILDDLKILSNSRVKIAGLELIKIKPDHSIDDASLNLLPVESFENFKVLFNHINKCFKKLS